MHSNHAKHVGLHMTAHINDVKKRKYVATFFIIIIYQKYKLAGRVSMLH